MYNSREKIMHACLLFLPGRQDLPQCKWFLFLQEREHVSLAYSGSGPMRFDLLVA